ncbi:hypothetical protein PYCC9005_003084 [Savitreella phatthalungensis]
MHFTKTFTSVAALAIAAQVNPVAAISWQDFLAGYGLVGTPQPRSSSVVTTVTTTTAKTSSSTKSSSSLSSSSSIPQAKSSTSTLIAITLSAKVTTTSSAPVAVVPSSAPVPVVVSSSPAVVVPSSTTTIIAATPSNPVVAPASSSSTPVILPASSSPVIAPASTLLPISTSSSILPAVLPSSSSALATLVTVSVLPAASSTLAMSASSILPAPAASSAPATGGNSNVLFPAYIYPDAGAWQPLYNALQAHPNVDFHIIINPNSGPGGASPDANYAQALNTLAKYPNAVLLGYVHVSWAKRAQSDVQSDVSTYVSWLSQGFSLDGIFFDEAPADSASSSLQYMAQVAAFARQSYSNAGTPGAIVYYNPGTIPDLGYYQSADYIAAFEDSYTNWLTAAPSFAPATTVLPISQTVAFVYGVPAAWNPANTTSFVRLLDTTDGFGSVFITNNPGSAAYNSFGSNWQTFVSAVDAINSS